MVEEYKDRLGYAMVGAMLTTPRLAEAMGLSYQAVRKVLQGNSKSFTAENNARAAEVLGVDPSWLATGNPRPEPGYKTVPAATSKNAPVPSVQEVDLDGHPDLSAIRTVKLKLQAGVSGFAVEPIDEDGPPIFFRNDWLRQRGYKPYNLVAVKVRGHSMETNLHDGDTVVIHTKDTEPQEGEVYAVNYEGEPVIKRLKRDRGTWWISSDNTDKVRFPDKECSDSSCIIVGRIVHKQSERI